MSRRVYLLLAAALLTLPIQAAAQTAWTPPRTPDGQPDLQGVWLSNTATPLERPKQLEGRARLTDEEVAEFRRRAERLFRTGNSDFAVGDGVYFMGSTENLKLVERFTRVAPDRITYEMTMTDPTTWTQPWTAMMPLRQRQERLYEFACHEGNYHIMSGMLLGAQKQQP